MQLKTQRISILGLVIFLMVSLSFQSCKKDTVFPDPLIEFSDETGYQIDDTTLLLGNQINIKIIAETQSDVPLTNFHVKIDKDEHVILIDSGISTDLLIYEKTITKSTALIEKWSFSVKDRVGRKSNEIILILNLDPSSLFGEITIIPSVLLGAQNNIRTGGFYSLNSGIIYNYDEADNNQSLINMLYYYDNIDTDEHTLASPGANIDNSIYDLSSWTIKNTTRYEEEEFVTEAEFDSSMNDSLILTNTFEFSTGKRKAKKLSPGSIFSFVTEDDIKGMFKVKNVSGQDAGTVEITIKMQEQ